MLIPIKRVYLNSGLEVEVLLNTDYMVKIESSDKNDKPKTKIVMWGIDELSFIYTNETIPQIKAKLTKARKNK